MPRRSRPRLSERRKQSQPGYYSEQRRWQKLAESLNRAEDKRRARAGLPPRAPADLARWTAFE